MDSYGSRHDEISPMTPVQRMPYRRQNSPMYQHVDQYDNNDRLSADPRGAYAYDTERRHTFSNTPEVRNVPVGSGEVIYTPSVYPMTPEIANDSRDQQFASRNASGDFSHDRSGSWSKPSETDYLTVSRAHRSSGSDTDLLISNSTPPDSCPTKGDVLKGRWSWYSITILVLAVFTTAFSGIFLVIAFLKPRWGNNVGTSGHLSFSTATLLSALFAKLIELSFVTVFVALLGQLLSRRAFAATSEDGGISIAEMNMRTWVMQPGTLVANWKGVRYGVTTLLGVVTLFAALCATLYTTAAEALVAPNLRMGPWQQKTMAGTVSAEYANLVQIENKCETPVTIVEDPVYRGTTCLQIDFAGQSFHNFKTYLSDWTDAVSNGNISKDASTSFADRPPPIAVLYDNTTVQGQWLDFGNIETDSNQFNRLVLNVTMALPHVNVWNAARNSINHILQPDDLQGKGSYSIQAAVPAPVLNVVCGGISTQEANANFIGNASALPSAWPNSGVLDQVFGFSALHETPPLFAKLPTPFNTLVNFTDTFGASSVYMLAAPPTNFTGNDDYVLCGLKSEQFSDCTTYYSATVSGGKLSAHCGNDPKNTMPFFKSISNSSRGGDWDKNWKDVGVAWIDSVSLSQGITDGNASIARLITQMIPPYNPGEKIQLDTSKPTIGEAMAVLAGTTLLSSSSIAPFVDFYNYSTPALAPPQLQYFDAQLQYVDYESGSSQNWQKVFYVILATTFLLNGFALGYLMWNFIRYGTVTDFTEPQNLFALAINSPPSRNMAGACGGGPHGRVLRKKWAVNMKTAPSGNPNEHPHFFVKYQDEKDDYAPSIRSRSVGDKFRSWRNNLSSTGRDDPMSHQHLKRKLGRPKSIFETDGRESPAVEQYQLLSGSESRNAL